MPILITHLVLDWLARLLNLQREVHARQQDGQDWFRRLRIRILAFLVSRYQHPAGDAELAGPTAPLQPPIVRPSFCAVEPHDAPPRKREDLGLLLERLSRHRRPVRPRRRWFL